jgi:adenine-specific DNA-methyltransferase
MPSPVTTTALGRRTEAAGRLLKAERDEQHRTQLGQFFTPAAVAAGMARLSALRREHIRLLDPGAGVGALTAAWVTEVCRRTTHPSTIAVTAFEVDARLHRALEETLVECARMCERAGTKLSWEIRPDDYIAAGVDSLDRGLFARDPLSFDVAILNPPYKKFRADSVPRDLLRRIGVDTSNLYAAFLSLTASLLAEGGEMIAITPRSFCNGPYFRQLRQHLFRTVSLDHIHVFRSRTAAFRDDRVLQENIVFRAVKQSTQQAEVTLVESDAPGAPPTITRIVPFVDVVRPDDPDQFIRLAPTDGARALAAASQRLPCTLTDLGLSVSTGRVVDFRARTWLRAEPGDRTIPLLYPSHFEVGSIRWPKTDRKKPNGIVRTSETEPLLVPAGWYVLVKRFSAKEERRRVTAATLDPTTVAAPMYGFENHLNYFHRAGLPLDGELARGLTAFLNSTAVDQYFRQFNGHTQVNAADLRSLRYPTAEFLRALGTIACAASPDYQRSVDAAVNSLLGLTE